jgi:hypothetical protein
MPAHIGGLKAVIVVPIDIAAVDTAGRNDFPRMEMLLIADGHTREVPTISGRQKQWPTAPPRRT